MKRPWTKKDGFSGKWWGWAIMVYEFGHEEGLAYDSDTNIPDVFASEEDAEEFCLGIMSTLDKDLSVKVVRVLLGINKVTRPKNG